MLTSPAVVDPIREPIGMFVEDTPFTALVRNIPRLVTLVVIRVSEASLSALLSQDQLGRRVHADLPAMKEIAELPSEFLHDSPEGDDVRRAAGAVPILRRDASPHAERLTMTMGYAIRAGEDGLVLFVHDTAGKQNVAVPGDPLKRVAFNELMVRILSSTPTLTDAHFNEWSRVSRSDSSTARLFECAIQYDVQLWVAGSEVDLASQGGRIVANIHGQTSSAERDAIRIRTTVGTLNALHAKAPGTGQIAWPYPLSRLPLGWNYALDRHGRPKSMSAGGGSKQKWKLVQLCHDEVVAVREVLRRAAEGRPWLECGQPLVEARVRCLSQRRQAMTFADLNDNELKKSVKRLVSSRVHLEQWLTGHYRRSVDVPVATKGDFQGYRVRKVHGTFGQIDIDLDFGLPEGGFLDADTLEKIERRIAVRERKSRKADGPVAMLAWMPPYRDADFTWERRVKRQMEYYVLSERTKAECFARDGKERGWDGHEGVRVLSVARRELEHSIALAVRQAVLAVADKSLAVILREPGPSDVEHQLRRQHQELLLQAAEARKQATRSDKLAGLVMDSDPGDDASILRHTRAASEKYAEADRCEQRAHQIAAEADRMVGERVEDRVADLATPAALAGTMAGYVGHDVPPEVNETLRRLGVDTLRLDLDPDNPRRVVWTMQLTLPLSDGGTAVIPVQGSARNAMRGASLGGSRSINDAVAHDFLRQGHDIEDLAACYGKDRKDIVKRLRSFLHARGVRSRGLRSAIVDLPTPLIGTRHALWCALTGDTPPAHLVILTDFLRETYTASHQHPDAWVRTETALVQRALNLLRDAVERGNTRGVEAHHLARTLGVSRTEITRLGGDFRGTGSTGARFRGVLVRDDLNPSLLRLRPCPHPDCVAVEGARWLSHYLPVPETSGFNGLLCPDCHRLPDLERSALYFPDSYFDHTWTGPANGRNSDLKTGPATRMVQAAEVPRLPTGFDCDYSIIEAAERLGITDASVRAWIKREDDPLRARRVTGRGGMKYAIASSELSRVEGSDEHLRRRRASPRPPSLADDVIALRELAAVTNVAEHYLRPRALRGDLGPVEYRSLAGTGPASLVVQRSVVNTTDPAAGTPTLPAAWIKRHRNGLLSMGEAVARTGASPHVIRGAVASEQLTSWITDGKTHRFDPADLDRWKRDRDRYPMTPREAAAYTGVTSETLRRAVRRGELKASPTPGRHLRYAPEDLDAWRR